MQYQGAVPEDGEIPTWMLQNHKVYYRDPRQVVHNILSNVDFQGEFDYTPFREFISGKRQWCDFMSRNWAWDQAVSFTLDDSSFY
jgi:Plavaka transposase